jgi:hypothetical protein
MLYRLGDIALIFSTLAVDLAMPNGFAVIALHRKVFVDRRK